MDPGLYELREAGDDDDEVAVIMRLQEGAAPPANARIVSTFTSGLAAGGLSADSVVTARIRRADVESVWEQVESLKAPRRLVRPSSPEDRLEPAQELELETDWGAEQAAWADGDPPDPRPVLEDGRGVLVGLCDWGFDFTHPNFRNPDGTTRLRALWDQRGGPHPTSPAPFGYGRLFTREVIDAALREPNPLAALQYSLPPAAAHATHVADIAVGNRREPGSIVGVAPRADILFVQLGSSHLRELETMGDWVDLLEALDFVRRTAGAQPCVLNLSAGQTGGPHCGTTLLERAIDSMLMQPGIALVQSVGNYADSAMHTHARIGPNQTHQIGWLIPRADRTPNELEVWYSGQDVLDVSLTSPAGQTFHATLGTRQHLEGNGTRWGNLYHRRLEPNSGQHHIDIHLYVAAPAGKWTLKLHGSQVVDGRIHAWIERDAAGRYQSRFSREQATPLYTTNTICNSFRAISVGAYDASQSGRPATRFSSRGPTADGRQKPELAAPGYRVLAARSQPARGWGGERKLCMKSGTSMAAPWVSGTVALMMQAAARPLTIHEIRSILIGTVDAPNAPSGRSSTRLGYGYLNIRGAVEAARALGRTVGTLRSLSPPESSEAAAIPTIFSEDDEHDDMFCEAGEDLCEIAFENNTFESEGESYA